MSTVSLDSLSWIKTELERTLETARRRLNAYAEEPDNPALLDEFIENVHQVAGTLAMVEVRGGRMLAEHMEALARAIREGRLAATSENFEPLMRASLELSDYLERMVSGMRDTPAVLLPIANEIRTLLGRSPLARERPGRAAPMPVAARPSGEDPVTLAARLRPRYQAALLAFYQGKEEDRPLARMMDIVAQLEGSVTSPPVFEFLWVTGGVLEALAEGGLAPSLRIKKALGQVERELKRLATGSEAAVAEAPPESLIADMLAELEQAHSSGERVTAIRGNFRLESPALETEIAAAGGPGSALLASAAGAILEDLGRVRDSIDIFVRTGSKNPSDLEPLGNMLKKVGDALGMLGLETARGHIAQERETVCRLAQNASPDASVLLGLATGLIGVESDVEAFLAGSGENPGAVAERRARVAGLREALADISRIKEAVGDYLRHPGAGSQLGELPQRADVLARTLDFLALGEVAGLMRRIGRYLERLKAGAGLPERGDLDRLADAVVSIEYYLETLQRGRDAPASMLENADRALQVLEAQPMQEAGASPAPVAVASPSPPTLADSPAESPQILPPVREAGADAEIVAVFMDEAAEVGETLAAAWPLWQANPDDREALAVIRRAFHTLKGSGRMVGARRLGEFAWAYENLLNRVIDYTLPPVEPIVAAVGAAIGALSELLAQFDSGAEPRADVQGLFERARRLSRDKTLAIAQETEADRAAGKEFADAAEARIEEPGPQIAAAGGEAPPETFEEMETEAVQPTPRLDPVLYGIYRRETEEHLASLKAWLDAVARGDVPGVTPELHRAVHTLSGSARMAGVSEMDALLSPLDRALGRIGEGNSDETGLFAPALEAAAGASAALLGAYADAAQPLPDWKPALERACAFERALEESGAAAIARAEVPASEEREGDGAIPVVDLNEHEAYDAELAQVFTTEANELLDGSDAAVHEWSQDHDLVEPLNGLLRCLHTLKGGARMAGVTPLADLTHELESVLTRVSDGRVAVSAELLHLVERTLDRMHRMLMHVSGDGRVPFDAAIVAELRECAGGREARPPEEETAADTPAEEPPDDEAFLHDEAMEEVATDADDAAFEALAELEDGEDGAEAVTQEAREAPDAERHGAPHLRHEMARVRADLLETSINNAGEVSIYRARIEQQLINMNVHIVELERTVERVRNQLRELEIETEAQILSSYEQRPEAAAPDFDPLEFDRYTRIHELSRSLAEAVSDLTSLRSLFATELRQADVLLDRQGRVNAELQDALMRTRMVPFALSAPRLRRVVRQLAEETGKRVELALSGMEGEMDRQLIGHILPALEHLLRNAVVHGIEAPALRASRGKPEVGHISLSLRRDGGDMLIEVADDGGGLDLTAIRTKAEEEGIIARDAGLTEAEISELIYRPGFSTATAVTQSAGRGVGMDVVAAEARQIGGSTEIQSTPQAGMRCRMRLPATLAITQVLLVRIGQTRYPVALASITGVARLARADLERLLEAEAPGYEYGGERYDLISLARLLDEAPPPPDERAARQPLLLVSAGGRRIALIAEDMEGSREIVVKPVGPQVARVPGLAGATIFGDGSIGLLLDLSALVRALPQMASAAASPMPAEHVREGPLEPLIMIVDDSITVRRVTQRLLERNGARVLTAKDGVEALELLQDHVPDLVLLDIEMPRMDGYELAGHMKNDAGLRTIPIIIITSRTGEKHRARAGQIGIERYLGKPYRDSDLIEAVRAEVPAFATPPTRAQAQ